MGFWFKWSSLFGGACLALLVLSLPSRAQDDNSQEVRFESADQVDLRGTFWPSAKGQSPCVILIHKIGGNRHQQGWDKLAKALQKNYAVLSFDLRGHGDSTSVNQDFWRNQSNMSYIKKANRNNSAINWKDFTPGYYPMLVNDIAAAKRYLNQQNNANRCNSSNVIVVGAESGAALGALWIATEWRLPRLTMDPLGRWVPDAQKKMEGEDITAAAWLSISPTLGSGQVAYWLKPPHVQKIPMAFIFGSGDTAGATSSNQFVSQMKAGSHKSKYLAAMALKGAGKSRGSDLLGKTTLDTEGKILNYLNNVMEDRGETAWMKREMPPPVMIPLTQFGFQLR